MGLRAVRRGDGMMGKNARQRRIVEIISRHDIDTQEELVS